MEEFLNNIHFLRAVWLWGLVPVGVIGLLLLLTTQQKENWRNAINKDILPFLIVRGDGISYLPKIMLLLVLTIMVISLAGPSWQKVEKPGGKIEAAMVVVVDASASMMAEDIGPSRMERTKQKIHDLLNASPGVHTSVVAFAGSAHLLIPFTNDYKAIDHQLKSLTPKVMPVGGSDLSLALELADSLLNRIEAPSTIVVFTDNITDKEIEVLKSRNDAQDRIELLAMATPGGAPIPVGRGRFLKDKSGQTVIPALDVDAVKRAAKIKSVNVSVITLDDSDVQRLASNIRQNMLYEKDPELQDEDWMDAGFWLVIPLSFIILLWFRRGWIVQWCLVLFAGSFTACTDLKVSEIQKLPSDWTYKDLWYTRDQQGQQLLDAGNTKEALATFEDPRQRAAILIELDRLEDASAILETIPTAESYYNLGIIHAELKNWVSSRTAFEKALEAKPDFAEARENLEIINAVIAKITARYGEITRLDEQDGSGRSEEKSELDELKDELKGEEQKTGGGENQEQTGDQTGASQTPKDDLMVQEGATQQQEAKDMILRQLSDDPAIFMQRKFRYQVLTGKAKQAKTAQPW